METISNLGLCRNSFMKLLFLIVLWLWLLDFDAIAQPMATTAPATNIKSNSATLNGQVNPNGSTTMVRFEFGPTISYGQTEPETDQSGTSSRGVSVQVTALSPNTTYHFRVVAQNAFGMAIGEDQCFRTSPSQGQAINLAYSESFPPNPDVTDFKIIGLPGSDNALSLKDFLSSGEQNKDWKIFWDNGTSYIPYSESDPNFKYTNVNTGRAFWVINRESLSIGGSGQTTAYVTLSRDRTTGIMLHPGWNLITNPFDFAVAWMDVQNANDTTMEKLYSYNRGYTGSPCFEPYVGYYFFRADSFTAKLTIPFKPACSGCPATDAPTLWRVKIDLNSGDFIDRTNSFGVAPESSKGFDRFDLRKPRAIASSPAISFTRPQWDAKYSTFATDIRPEFGDSESWDFEVRTVPQAAAQLAFSGLANVPPQFEVYLIDESKARPINLRADSVYQFTPAAEINKFTVVVGQLQAIKDKLSALALPQSFRLGPNYPNPFNPETTIPVTLAAAAEAELIIFNATGQEVKTLHRGVLEAGKYWFSWDGRNAAGGNMASGLYLCRLRADTKLVHIQKMILLR